MDADGKIIIQALRTPLLTADFFPTRVPNPGTERTWSYTCLSSGNFLGVTEVN